MTLFGSGQRERVLAAVDDARDEIVDFTRELIRIPTVNPPGEHYEVCARTLGDRLERLGFDVEYYPADGRPEHTARYPRINVVGLRRGLKDRPLLHLNGHLDVVPPGAGWSVDPFEAAVRDGRIYGRGACDMKAGLAAAVYAAEAVRRAGVPLTGSLEVSGTADEESGGFAGMAWLAEHERVTAARTDFVVIPEPFGPTRICIGHRGVYWFEIATSGRTAHGSMPFLGVSAIDRLTRVLHALETRLKPVLASRITAMPVVPPEARRATMNVNAIKGGQFADAHLNQTPCVADRASAIIDRRFLAEEGFEQARAELVQLLDDVAGVEPAFRYELDDLMVVHPVMTPVASPLVRGLTAAIEQATGMGAELVASPGSYDHKHVARLGGIQHCVAYGPGRLELAHQPDEWCGVDDLLQATKVLALAICQLVGREPFAPRDRQIPRNPEVS